jgi:hypothetical protein
MAQLILEVSLNIIVFLNSNAMVTFKEFVLMTGTGQGLSPNAINPQQDVLYLFSAIIQSMEHIIFELEIAMTP